MYFSIILILINTFCIKKIGIKGFLQKNILNTEVYILYNKNFEIIYILGAKFKKIKKNIWRNTIMQCPKYKTYNNYKSVYCYKC